MGRSENSFQGKMASTLSEARQESPVKERSTPILVRNKDCGQIRVLLFKSTH